MSDVHGVGADQAREGLTYEEMVEGLRARGDPLSFDAANALIYLRAQEELLEDWQQRAKRAEEAAADVRRPLDAQMARLNARVVEQNEEIARLSAANMAHPAGAMEAESESADLEADTWTFKMKPGLPRERRALPDRAAAAEPGERDMNRADCKALRSAALQLLKWADILRASYQTQTGYWDPSVAGSEGGKLLHDKHRAMAKRLRAIANAEQAKLPRRHKALADPEYSQ